MSTTAQQPRISGVEVRSIDYVPLNERHGKLWHLGPLWFMSNAQIATLAVGLISFFEGGNLIWSLIAIIVGILRRHALHGVPLGPGPAARPAADDPVPAAVRLHRARSWCGSFAYLQYAGFNVFNTILAGKAMHATVARRGQPVGGDRHRASRS